MLPEEAINVGGEPAHWANQCLLLLEPFVEYLRMVRDTNTMHPENAKGDTESVYRHAHTFYDENGTLAWITSRLVEYAPTALRRMISDYWGNSV